MSSFPQLWPKLTTEQNQFPSVIVVSRMNSKEQQSASEVLQGFHKHLIWIYIYIGFKLFKDCHLYIAKCNVFYI